MNGIITSNRLFEVKEKDDDKLLGNDEGQKIIEFIRKLITTVNEPNNFVIPQQNELKLSNQDLFHVSEESYGGKNYFMKYSLKILRFCFTYLNINKRVTTELSWLNSSEKYKSLEKTKYAKINLWVTTSTIIPIVSMKSKKNYDH